VDIYLIYKILEQINKIKYIGIIFYGYLLFREHKNYIEDKCLKLVFALFISAKITWVFGHEALKSMHRKNLTPDDV